MNSAETYELHFWYLIDGWTVSKPAIANCLLTCFQYNNSRALCIYRKKRTSRELVNHDQKMWAREDSRCSHHCFLFSSWSMSTNHSHSPPGSSWCDANGGRESQDWRNSTGGIQRGRKRQLRVSKVGTITSMHGASKQLKKCEKKKKGH